MQFAGAAANYRPMWGIPSYATAEANGPQNPIASACSLYWFSAVIAQSNTTSTCTYTIRLNGTDGSANLSIGAAATGAFYDTTHTDSLTLNQMLAARGANQTTGFYTSNLAVVSNTYTAQGYTKSVSTSTSQSISKTQIANRSIRTSSSQGQTITLPQIGRLFSIPLGATSGQFISGAKLLSLSHFINVSSAQSIGRTVAYNLSRSFSQFQTISIIAGMLRTVTVYTSLNQLVALQDTATKLIIVTQRQTVSLIRLGVDRTVSIVQLQTISIRNLVVRSISTTLSQSIRVVSIASRTISILQAQFITARKSVLYHVHIAQAQLVAVTRIGIPLQIFVTQAQAASVRALRVFLFPIGFTLTQIVRSPPEWHRGRNVLLTQGQTISFVRAFPYRVLGSRIGQSVSLVWSRGIVRRALSIAQAQSVHIRSTLGKHIRLWTAQNIHVTRAITKHTSITLRQIISRVHSGITRSVHFTLSQVVSAFPARGVVHRLISVLPLSQVVRSQKTVHKPISITQGQHISRGVVYIIRLVSFTNFVRVTILTAFPRTIHTSFSQFVSVVRSFGHTVFISVRLGQIINVNFPGFFPRIQTLVSFVGKRVNRQGTELPSPNSGPPPPPRGSLVEAIRKTRFKIIPPK
jgi:hypothetical protein